MGCAALKKDVRPAVEENDRNPRLGDPLCIARLHERAAAEGEDDAMVCGVAIVKNVVETIGLDLPEVRLTRIAEDVGHAAPFSFANTIVEIDDCTAELLRQDVTDSGLPGAHESDEYDSGTHPVSVNTLRNRTKGALRP